MFCEKCGRELPEESRFCLTCGSPVGAIGTTPVVARSVYCEHTATPGTYTPPLIGYGQISQDNQNSYNSAKKIILVILSIVVFLALVAFCNRSTDRTSGTTQTTAPTMSTTAPKVYGPAYNVSVEEILKEFDENELRADQKYVGENIRVYGYVDKVDTDIFDSSTYILRLKTSASDWGLITVKCYGLPKSVLANLDSGEFVAIQGSVSDGGSLGVTLKNCSVDEAQ